MTMTMTTTPITPPETIPVNEADLRDARGLGLSIGGMLSPHRDVVDSVLTNAEPVIAWFEAATAMDDLSHRVRSARLHKRLLEEANELCPENLATEDPDGFLIGAERYYLRVIAAPSTERTS